MRRFLLVTGAILLCAGSVCPAEAPAENPKSPAEATAPAAKDAADRAAEVESLIRQLGDDDVKIRDEASRKLKAMGRSVAPALKTAMKAEDADPEVVGRCQAILDAFHLSDILEQASKGSTQGKATAGNFTRNEKKEVYVGGHSMKVTYTWSARFSAIKDLAVRNNVVPAQIVRAVQASKGIDYTLPVPMDKWPEKADKPDEAWLTKTLDNCRVRGEQHERMQGRVYIEALKKAGVDVPMPTEWKKLEKEDANRPDKIGGAS